MTIFATPTRWGKGQAEDYVRRRSTVFGSIGERRFPGRPAPAEFGLECHVRRYERRYIYWKLLSGGDVGIVTVCTNAGITLIVCERTLSRNQRTNPIHLLQAIISDNVN